MLLQRATLPLFGVLLALLISEARSNPLANKLQVQASWKTLDFAYACPEDRQEAIDSKDFIPGNSMPNDVDVHYKNESRRLVVMAIPRMRPGVPVTLGYVSKNLSSDGSYLIAPYPNWESQQFKNCNDSLISVWKIQIDRCNRLWVVDSGRLGKSRVCPPKLLTFSLETNELISSYVFPEKDLTSNSLLITPIVDTRGEKCQNTFVYVTDYFGFGIIVYDDQSHCTWRVNSNLFYPYPNRAKFSIDDIKLYRMDGISAGAVTSATSNGERYLLFHSASSTIESFVPTSVIRNQSLFENNPNAVPDCFIPFKNQRDSQSAAEALDLKGVLYFGLLGKAAIACWNSNFLDYGKNSIERIAVNRETLQFPAGVKVIRRPNGVQALVVLSNNFHRYLSNTLNPNKTNFYILSAPTDNLIEGTKCDSATRTGPL